MMNVPVKRKSTRNETIELMRFVLTIGVCLHHFYGTLVSEGCFPFFNGYFAVEFFFVIGGCFLAAGALKMDLDQPLWQSGLQLLKKRFIKLLVPFYTGHLITFAIRSIAINQTGPAELFRNYISDVSLLTFVKQAGFDYFYGYGHTWYISSMFLAFLVIVPLLLRYRENFMYLAAPVVAVFLYGYMNHEYGESISNLNLWTGFLLKGQMRAFADICLGVFLHGVITALRKIRFTAMGRVLLTMLEVASYTLLLYYMFSDGRTLGRQDYVMLFFLGLAILLSLSGITFSKTLFAGSRIIPWLGQFSLYLYLMHYVIAVEVMPRLIGRIPQLPISSVIYLVLVALCSLLLWLLCALIRKWVLPFFKKLILCHLEADTGA